MSREGTGGGAPTAVIADDHQAMRLGVRMALMRGGFDVVAEAADCEGAVSATVREQPDVCLLDIRMPGGGIEAAAAIAASVPSTAVVMLTVSNDTDDVLAALRAGALGYLPKDTRPDRLPAALCGVLKGEAALPRVLVGRVLSQLRGFDAVAELPIRVGDVELTRRESEIMRLLHSGMSTIEVGELLSLSPITIRRHVSAAVAKLGVADREAALLAI
jgi:DNA-binding NarL/FixJ family response regulator